MKDKYTHIQILLDRSGSMGSMKEEVEGGMAHFLEEQRKVEGEATIGLDQFDDEFETVYPPSPLADAPEFVLQPRGWTALLDAMGRSITNLGKWLAGMKEADRPSQVIFVIITDGFENRSREWNREQVFELVKEQTEKYGWDFKFLAANQDAIATGASFGVARGSSLTYDTSKAGDTFTVLAANTTASRVTGQSVAYTDEDRKKVT